MAAPGVTRPALSQLVVAHASQSRSIWRCARNGQANRDKMERVARRIDKYQRHPEANLRRKGETRHDWPSTTHRDPSSTWGWGLSRSRSSFSDLSAGREQGFWDAERAQMHHRMAHLKKNVTKDPYSAAFSRRPDDFPDVHNSEGVWPGFLRTFMGADKLMSDHPAKAHLQDFNFTRSQASQSENRDALQYDPISGRMAPLPPSPSSQALSGHAGGYTDCPPGSEVEAHLASNSSTVEDGQFQPGSVTNSEQTKLNSQSIDCPPGSELEVLFTANPTSYKDIRTGAGLPKESAYKPNINITCPPGSELEALFISESVPSQQPQAEIFQVTETLKRLDKDAGLRVGRNTDCAPGSELDALFTASPAARVDQSRPSKGLKGQPSGVSVDCPPGNELEAKFASEFPSLDTQAQNEIAADSIDCSPGSELEAKILSESAAAPQQTLGSPVDCPPGSELEAMFAANPAAAKNAESQPTIAAEDANLKKVNVTIDCAPGSELEAKFLSDMVSAETRGESEDLSALQARDIRTRYASLKSDVDADAPIRAAKDLDFEGSEDRVGDFVSQHHQILSTGQQEWSSADYRILAFDSSTSKVTTAEADAFFGTSETTQPHEVLSRLHNPAKFVPYFSQMQQDGYEISTGGGDILVFRKAAKTPKNTSTASVSTQDSVPSHVHADIAKYLCHDSYDSVDTHARPYHPSSPKPIGPSNSSRITESSTRRVFRRMVLTGTSVAASCYAIGTVTEYFRNGGKDGQGIDGFTAFEMERRHRE
ncbi:hypothetical protein N7462_008615 [Penicillium macrosclerotiorum]|uniref:uncharacterized protein n=1 Tax=Penicillium macrosclerotiorum TaxID=303699 RepID=UPI002547E836|nr:uncharacterized protein N7462_008615 [Penicillium macrosclerotiorum]KAJ5675718.1 hypothetical protein N7462_008615 [Penicillium macrosclerotiorum]